VTEMQGTGEIVKRVREEAKRVLAKFVKFQAAPRFWEVKVKSKIALDRKHTGYPLTQDAHRWTNNICISSSQRKSTSSGRSYLAHCTISYRTHCSQALSIMLFCSGTKPPTAEHHTMPSYPTTRAKWFRQYTIVSGAHTLRCTKLIYSLVCLSVNNFIHRLLPRTDKAVTIENRSKVYQHRGVAVRALSKYISKGKTRYSDDSMASIMMFLNLEMITLCIANPGATVPDRSTCKTQRWLIGTCTLVA
jgi:hypothetical protein